MYKLENAPLTLSGIFIESWEFTKASFLAVIVWSIILSILHIIPDLFGLVSFFVQDEAGRLVFSWWGLLVNVILLIAVAYFVAVLLYTMYSIATEHKVDHKKIFRLSLMNMVTVYFGLLIYYVLVNFGLMLFILPAVFIAILFSMFLPLILFENQGLYPSYQNSARLVWGHWWQTFFVLMVPYAISYLLRSLFKITNWGGEWMLLVDIVIQSLIMPYFYAALIIQFNNLKTIKSLPEPISTGGSRTSNP